MEYFLPMEHISEQLLLKKWQTQWKLSAAVTFSSCYHDCCPMYVSVRYQLNVNFLFLLIICQNSKMWWKIKEKKTTQ